jgi:hypothetical protein
MADVVLRPSFPTDELERLRKERLTSLLQARDDPASIAEMAFPRLLYGASKRYGVPTVGTPETIRSFTPADLRSSIISASMKLNSFTLLTDICQNSLYTSARVRRSILSLVFGIIPEDTLCKPAYTLLLAADEEGCAFVKNRKKQFGIPVITKPAHIKKESDKVQKVFYREAQSDSIIALSAPGFESENVMEKTPYIKFSK